MNSLKKSVKPEIVNHYDLWVLRHKIGGTKVFATINSPIDAVKFSNTIQLSPN
jgi:hypothetical protein